MAFDWKVHVTSDAAVGGGRLCARGTRVPIAVILDSFAEGASREEILRSYPTLRAEHLDAALAYAADLAHQEEIVPLVRP